MTNEGPWTAERGARLVMTNLAALFALVASAYEAHTADSLRGALGWLNVGLVALIVVGAMNGLWLLHGRRTVTVARVALLPGPIALAPSTTVARDDGALAAGPRMTRFHRPTCPLIAGKTVRLQSRREHDRAGRRPCETCEP